MAKKLFYSDNCGHCAAAKEKLKSEIDSGEVKLVNIDTDKEGFDIARRFGGVPTFVNDKGDQLCEISLESGNEWRCKPKDASKEEDLLD